MNVAPLTVTDTALWVAAIRAAESERADAVFLDPLAAMLAGERGRRIERAMPHAAATAWGVVVRTSAIDRLIDVAVRAGADTIVNLGAGLDTRPYRMQLPVSLRWIEIDFPSLAESKEATLRDSRPVCRLERIGLDLRDRELRQAVLTRCAAGAQNVLVIAEGVIPYLATAEVALLARDLAAIDHVRAWILDFDDAGPRTAPREWDAQLAGAPSLFQVNRWFEFFAQAGWRPATRITTFEESRRLHRPYPLRGLRGLIMLALPKSVRRRILEVTGAVLMEKATPA